MDKLLNKHFETILLSNLHTKKKSQNFSILLFSIKSQNFSTFLVMIQRL